MFRPAWIRSVVRNIRRRSCSHCKFLVKTATVKTVHIPLHLVIDVGAIQYTICAHNAAECLRVSGKSAQGRMWFYNNNNNSNNNNNNLATLREKQKVQ